MIFFRDIKSFNFIEKKSFKTFAIFLSFVIIFALSTNVKICLKALALPYSKIFDYLGLFVSFKFE